MKCQNFFSEKNKKYFLMYSLLKILSRVLSVSMLIVFSTSGYAEVLPKIFVQRSTAKLKTDIKAVNPDIPRLCKQCRSRSVGFLSKNQSLSRLIWICSICHSMCEFVSTARIKQSD